jgi:hypothetical protein
MNINELELKWDLLKPENKDGFKSIRISPDCIPDLYIGIDINSIRCLILKLPLINDTDFQSIIKQNLSIELFRDSKWIVIKLLNNSFTDLFNDLIMSLFNKIKDEVNSENYIRIFIEIFYKWSEFFIDNSINRLSELTIQGIYGELLFLNEMISQKKSDNVNEIIQSWQGLYDRGHDFIFNDINIEVKTKEENNLDISISSEFQLEPEPAKPLKLVVVNILKNKNGSTLGQLVLITRQLIVERLGDFTIVLKALAQKGLTLKSINEYEHIKFEPINIITYDCMNSNFPKIVRSEIPSLINNVKYNVRINALKEFIIDKKEF